MTDDERLAADVINNAVNGLLRGRVSLPQANAALQFFHHHADRLAILADCTLIKIAEAMRDRPAEWVEMIRHDCFRPLARRPGLRLPDCPVIVPTPKIQITHKIVHGDFLDQCHQLDNASVDLVLTSPPYAEQRKPHYASVTEQDYPGWTVGWMNRVRPKLAPGGSVLINLGVIDHQGVDSDYILDTLNALRAAGWLRHRTQVWSKPDALPRGNIKWPRNAYEFVFWFSLTRTPYCGPKAAGKSSDRIGVANWTKHGFRGGSRSQGIARCSDLIEIPIAANVRAPGNDHPAPMPEPLARHLITVHCPRRGKILDPFAGIGTTVVAAKSLERSGIGFEMVGRWVNIARQRLNEVI